MAAFPAYWNGSSKNRNEGEEEEDPADLGHFEAEFFYSTCFCDWICIFFGLFDVGPFNGVSIE